MCGPLALGIMQTVVGVGSTLFSAVATSSASKYSAQINERNATFAERRARDALARGVEEEQRVRAEGAQVKGNQVAGMAAAGLDLGFGSPLDVLTDTTIGIDLDSARVRRNANLEADDYDRQAWNYRANASMDRSSAKSAVVGGVLGGVGSVLTGYSDYQTAKAKANIA